MEALKCIETRRSVRKFKDEALDHEVLEAVVKEASFAPSWKNSQVVRYVVVENQEIKSKIANDAVLGFTYNTGTIEKAAALVVVTMIHGRSGFEKDGSYTTSKEDRWEMFDAGIATQTFCLAAHEKGIGSVIMGIFDEDKVAELISLEEGRKVAALIAVGYPDEEPAQPKRKEVGELVRFL
ncbi:MAG: nitroreductase family protein [Lachnospiraceae bacterium]|nr:nitroreductase family protein [Lachnospiraceae bacterium]